MTSNGVPEPESFANFQELASIVDPFTGRAMKVQSQTFGKKPEGIGSFEMLHKSLAKTESRGGLQ